jgi:hypothetical protein
MRTSDDFNQRLAKAAKREGLSKAEAIRRAVDLWIRTREARR